MPQPMFPVLFRLMAFCLFALTAAEARAEGKVLDAFPVDQKIRLDGLLREWPRLTALSFGSVSATRAEGLVGYDENNLYVAMKIKDPDLVRSKNYGMDEDVASLYLGFPTGRSVRVYRVALFPGDPGKVPGAVRIDGKVPKGAKLVEAPGEGGVTLEASIPWKSFPEAVQTRVGLRGALEYSDRDPGGGQAIVATAPSRAAAALPELTMEAEYALGRSLLQSKRLGSEPRFWAMGDVAGDAFKEKVAVYGRYLTMVGWSYRGGKEFFFQDLTAENDGGVKSLELRDLTGDGKDEILLRKRITIEGLEREIFQVLSVSPGSENPFVAFQHELELSAKDQSVENRLQFQAVGGKIRLRVSQGKTSPDLDPKAFELSGGEGLHAALMPWDSVQSRAFEWNGQSFALVDEATGKARMSRPGAVATGADRPEQEAPPPPRPPSPDELLERVYALYKSEHNVGKARPRFDFVTDVAADSQNERIVIHGKDIVAFGKGFQDGQSYVYLNIGVDKPEDITGATAIDLTGDGKAEVIVYGVVRAKASKNMGGGVITRHVLFIYRIRESGIKRVFAAETGRSLEDRAIFGRIAFPASGKGVEIELRPGHAVDWSEATYPFPPDRFPYGGFEPLLLPWTDMPVRRYRYTEEGFVGQ